MAAVFAKHDVGAVIHFAGLKAVGESVAKPQLYYEVNVQGTLVLLEVMPEAGWLGLRLTQAQALTQTLTLTLTTRCTSRRRAAACIVTQSTFTRSMAAARASLSRLQTCAATRLRKSTRAAR